MPGCLPGSVLFGGRRAQTGRCTWGEGLSQEREERAGVQGGQDVQGRQMGSASEAVSWGAVRGCPGKGGGGRTLGKEEKGGVLGRKRCPEKRGRCPRRGPPGDWPTSLPETALQQPLSPKEALPCLHFLPAGLPCRFQIQDCSITSYLNFQAADIGLASPPQSREPNP